MPAEVKSELVQKLSTARQLLSCFTWREEDRRRWIILASRFLYSVYTQKVVRGPTARIFPSPADHVQYLRSEGPSTRDKKMEATEPGVQLLKADNFSSFPSQLAKHPDRNFCM